MALRDPGAPRRNPLFAVDDVAGPNLAGHESAGPGVAGPDAVGPDAVGPDEGIGDDGWDDWVDDPIFGRPSSGGSDNPLFGAPGSAVGPFVAALTEAGPEAAEHLVNAAHELTLAIKVVVEAFERTLAEQRATFAAEHAEARDSEPDIDLTDLSDVDVVLDADEHDSAAGATGDARPRVQNIDVE